MEYLLHIDKQICSPLLAYKNMSQIDADILKKKRHIAIILDSDGNIISMGVNDYIIPDLFKKKFSIHAEENAIKALLWKVSHGKYKRRQCHRLTMYIIAIGEGPLRQSHPCHSCCEMLNRYSSWFHRIYYSSGIGFNIERYKR